MPCRRPSLLHPPTHVPCLAPRLATPPQPRYLPLEEQRFFRVGLQPLLLSFMIVTLIAGLGGPTTYAANPARDLGPRIAHFLLPIPNKGRSEWVYAVSGGMIRGEGLPGAGAGRLLWFLQLVAPACRCDPCCTPES